MTDCVNRETRTCVFGYGGVRVEYVANTILFEGIKPPVGAGTHIFDKDNGQKVGDWEYTGHVVRIELCSMAEVETLHNLLSEVEANYGGSFEFKGITLDFTHYKQISMDVVVRVVLHAKRQLCFLLAC